MSLPPPFGAKPESPPLIYVKVETMDLADRVRTYRNVYYQVREIAGLACLIMSKDGEDTVVPASSLQRWTVRAEKKQ